jgi:hypothetical protein
MLDAEIGNKQDSGHIMIETTQFRNVTNCVSQMSNVMYLCMAHVLKSTETVNYTNKDANGIMITECLSIDHLTLTQKETLIDQTFVH